MFCPKCATQNADDARFCRGCGTDISLVPQAVSGALAERMAVAEEEDGWRDRRDRRRYGRRGPSIERAVKSVFMGLAFVMIALAIVLRMPGGFTWGYWLFLPAAALLAKGVGMYLRLQEDRKRIAPPAHNPAYTAVPPPRHVSALPQRETGEMIPPPSVTEGTTRHLGVPVERKRGE
ncbi:MAG: zinc ribbon domain-containing protein [Acidobacteria bacterium]|nr:zinc ribbon domain-containing protein [Acidobacteriota bacterium]